MTFAYEGDYDANLPFHPEDSHGVRFEMDETEFVICGDLAGHVIYRRVNGDSACYSLTWAEFSEDVADGSIIILGEVYE